MIRTDDLFLGGFALVRGGELVGVGIRGTDGRRVAVFEIEGPAALAAERDYYRGTTSVDLQLLKLQIRRLKDRAFDALREEERRRKDADDERGDRKDPRREPHRAGPR